MLSLDELLERGKDKIKIYKDFRLRADAEVTRKLTLCIPDMHLLEKGPTDDFYENKKENERRFLGLLRFLKALQDSEQEEIEIIQLGDMFDLWQARGNTNLIQEAYTNLLGKLDQLHPVYIVGNHDIDLIQWYKEQGETFGRRWRYFSTVEGKQTVIYEHGFQADFANNQGSWSGALGRSIATIVGMLEYLYPDIDVLLGDAWDSISRSFRMYNDGLTPQKHPEGFNLHEYLNYYIDLMEKYNGGDTDDHHDPTALSLAVVAHTHSARLVKKPKDGKAYYLMDCGSWVNGGHEMGIIAGAELALCQWG